jgi:hypothetical protein
MCRPLRYMPARASTRDVTANRLIGKVASVPVAPLMKVSLSRARRAHEQIIGEFLVGLFGTDPSSPIHTSLPLPAAFRISVLSCVSVRKPCFGRTTGVACRLQTPTIRHDNLPSRQAQPAPWFRDALVWQCQPHMPLLRWLPRLVQAALDWDRRQWSR